MANQPYVGQIIEAKIDRLGAAGAGRFVLDSGVSVDLLGAVPGDWVRCKLSHISQHHPRAWGEIIALERGPHFQQAPCPHAAPTQGHCGGCPLMHFTDIARHQALTTATKESLEKHIDGHWLNSLTLTPAKSTQDWRQRAQYVATRDPQGRLIFGSFRRSSHEVVAMPNCRVVDPKLRRAETFLREALIRLNAPIHPEKAGIRYLRLRSASTGALADLICNADNPALIEQLSQLAESDEIEGLQFSINDSSGNAIRAPEPGQWIFGPQQTKEQVGPLELWVDIDSFTQLNPAMAALIYQQAARWAPQAKHIWDLFCGVGGLGLSVAHHLNAKVFGAEVVAPAVELAKRNAAAHSIDAEFICADLVKQKLPPHWPKPDLILVNPPRRGLSSEVIAHLRRHTSPIIYMSCNPKSFARDLKSLGKAFHLKGLQAFEMLPLTDHVELLALIEPTSYESTLASKSSAL